MARQIITTQVAILGAGPAGLMLSHLLAKAGIESTVIEIRSRQEISETVRAGILEHGTVNMLVDGGVSDRVLREGDRHDGIEPGSTVKATASTSRNSWGNRSGCIRRPTSSRTSPPAGRLMAATCATA
jgi:2-polyprenyl-6-methoxyphenol hydroxylase-like FAD-dependent oxidoreductase